MEIKYDIFEGSDLIPQYTFNGIPVYVKDTVPKDKIFFIDFNKLKKEIDWINPR